MNVCENIAAGFDVSLCSWQEASMDCAALPCCSCGSGTGWQRN